MIESWWTFASIGMTVWVLGLSIWILFEKRSPMSTLAWIFGLSVLPVFGILVYFAIGPRRFDRKKLRRRFAKEAARRIGRASTEPVDSEVAHDTFHVMNMCEAAGGVSARPRAATLTLFTTGEAKYAAMLEAIDAAQHHIHFEYYIWSNDEIGRRIRDRLVARASEGVEVRVLIDSFGSSSANRSFWKPLRAAGGQVSRFNALTLRRLGRRLANFRSHRKILVVDGIVGFTGGMNLAEYHSAEFRGDKAWRDTHVRIRGPAVRGLQLVFFEGWHYATGSAPEGAAYFPSAEAQAEDDDAQLLQVVASGPDENRNAIHKLYISTIASANHRVFLSTAYFVPDAPMLAALATAAMRGADVRLLVPANSDVRMVAAAARSYYRELCGVGVRIFEYGPNMLHTKTLVVDDRVTVIGTANADARSFLLNFEVVIAAYRSELCEEMAETFELDLENATEVDELTIDGYGFFRRLGQNFARLFSPVL